MSNRLRGFKSHPANKISNIEKEYIYFIKRAIKYAMYYGYGKHIGSKKPQLLKLMMKD